MKSLYNVLILNIFILSWVAVAFSYGLIQPYFLNDITHISWFIAVLMLVNILFSTYVAYHKDQGYRMADIQIWGMSIYLQWIVGKFFYIGLAGTFFATLYLFNHIDLTTITDIDSIRLLVKFFLTGLIGIGTTSLAGIIAYLWSSLNNFILFRE